MRRPVRLFGLWVILGWCSIGHAHHILGRPAYSLNEDSNTPPSMQVETQIGDYRVSYMVYPAFPRPDGPGRINLYATHLDTTEPLNSVVTFTVREDNWLGSGDEEVIGTQVPSDSVYRQGFAFKEAGDYIITAKFEAGGESYQVDFPLRVGDSSPAGLIGVLVSILAAILIGVSIAQRKRINREKVRSPGKKSTSGKRVRR